MEHLGLLFGLRGRVDERRANIRREAGDPDSHAGRGSGDERLPRICSSASWGYAPIEVGLRGDARGIRAICRDEPRSAEKIQAKVREQFIANIAKGRTAVAFEFSEEQGTHLLERYED